MRRIMTILATAVLASTLLATAADARGGGGGGGHMGGFGGGHMGGFGGDMGRMGGGGMGFREHAMHHFGPGYFDDGLGCAYPDEAPKAPPWPPYCG